MHIVFSVWHTFWYSVRRMRFILRIVVNEGKKKQQHNDDKEYGMCKSFVLCCNMQLRAVDAAAAAAVVIVGQSDNWHSRNCSNRKIDRANMAANANAVHCIFSADLLFCIIMLVLKYDCMIFHWGSSRGVCVYTLKIVYSNMQSKKKKRRKKTRQPRSTTDGKHKV